MKPWFALLLVVSMAGCFEAPIPDDAITVTDRALPGLEMQVWLQEVGGRMQLHAVVTNTGDEGYWMRLGCGHPWEVSLTGPSGDDIGFREVLEESNCAAVQDILQPRQTQDILYSWDYLDHDPEADEAEPVPGGTYTWSIAFTLRDHEATLYAQMPFEFDAGPLDFSMDLVTRTANDQYLVNATVTNNGPPATFHRGCGTEWDMEILDAAGEPVLLEPMFSCDGFQTSTFHSGETHSGQFVWDGMVYDGDEETLSPAPAGQYTWSITFMPTGAGPDRSGITETAEFNVA